MLPFQPPLPTARNLPFQPATGSQISILMSDSLVGFNVAATRQKAGRSANGLVALPPPRPGGAVIAPAATLCAIVTVASLNLRPLRLSQVAACAARAASRSAEAAKVATRLERMR